MDLVPNHSPFPTEAWNNTQLAPYIGLSEGQALAISETPETVGIGNEFTGDMVTPQGPITSLMALRHQFPYLQILPWSNEIETVALVQNVPSEVRLPSGAVAILFQGFGNYYVSTQGNAQIPVPGGPSTRSIFKPERFLFFVNGMHSLSVVSPDAACVVTMMCFAPREFPR